MTPNAIGAATRAGELLQQTLTELTRLQQVLPSRDPAAISSAVRSLKLTRQTVSKLLEATATGVVRETLLALGEELGHALDPVGPQELLPFLAQRRIRALGNADRVSGTVHVNVGAAIRAVDRALSEGSYLGIAAEGPHAASNRQLLLEAIGSGKGSLEPRSISGQALLTVEKRALIQLWLDPTLHQACDTLPELSACRYAVHNAWFPPLYRRRPEFGGEGLWWSHFRAELGTAAVKRVHRARELDAVWHEIRAFPADTPTDAYDLGFETVVPELRARTHVRAALNQAVRFSAEEPHSPYLKGLLSALDANLTLNRQAHDLQQILFFVQWPNQPQKVALAEAFAASDTPFRLYEIAVRHLRNQSIPAAEHSGILLDNLSFFAAIAAWSLQTLEDHQGALGVNLLGADPRGSSEPAGFGVNVVFRNGKFSFVTPVKEGPQSELRTGCPFLHGGSIRQLLRVFAETYDRARALGDTE